ncbi:MAG: hypothetical protein NTW26_09920 [bacterium]|nr:hypothetical protein [bacterium]
MRKHVWFLIALVCLIPLACGEEKAPSDGTDGGEVVTAPARRDVNLERFGVTFSVANDLWDDGELIQDPANDSDTAMLLSPKTGAYLSVFCQNRGQELTVEDRDLALEDKLWELEPSFPDMTEVGREQVDLSGIKAVRVEFTFNVEDTPWRAWDWTLVKGQTLCGIQFAASQKDWKSLMGELDAVLASFEMTGAEVKAPLAG